VIGTQIVIQGESGMEAQRRIVKEFYDTVEDYEPS
jgi:hypothetical protein